MIKEGNSYMSEKITIEKVAKLRKTQIIFALCCLIASGLVGVFFREFVRAFSEGLEGEELFFASYHLSIDHGHLVSIGFIIPLGLALVTYFVQTKLNEKQTKRMNIYFNLYMITGIAVFLLLFYKGIHYMVYSSRTIYSLLEIDELLYGGSIIIRSIIYAIVHTLYGVTTLLYSIPVFVSLRKSRK
jgi:hypothetical protein